MIELKNSKTQYLGKASGRDRYSLDAFIGAVQMREPGGPWQDIKPALVRDADGWHVEGAPYYAEIKDSGARLFCPDKNERNSYLRLPAPALFSGLASGLIHNPNKLDGEILPNQITLPAEWGEYHIIFSNTGMHFEILFTKAPPSVLFGKDSPRIVLDVETAGLDIEQLLKSREGTGIPKPRLMSTNGEIEGERCLDWSYKNGQLELGFDFGDLAFPVLLKNTTVEVQVGNDADDGGRYSGSNGFRNNATQEYAGYSTNAAYLICSLFWRFTGVTVSGTVGTSYIEAYTYAAGAGSPEMKIYGVDEDNPDAPANATEFDADPLTDVAVDWDISSPNLNQWYTSSSITGIIQELVDSYAISNDAIMFQVKNDGGTSNANYIGFRTHNSDPDYAAKLHIEYTTGGGATAKTSAETGAGAEGSLLKSALSRTDTTGGVDTRQSLLASLTKDENGAGVEQSLLESLAAKLSVETGYGSDTAALIAGLASIESGLGVDVGWLVGLKSILSGDGGVAADALKALVGTSSVGSEMKLPGRQGQVKIPSKGVSL
jgi:hypothetical protein